MTDLTYWQMDALAQAALGLLGAALLLAVAAALSWVLHDLAEPAPRIPLADGGTWRHCCIPGCGTVITGGDDASPICHRCDEEITALTRKDPA